MSHFSWIKLFYYLYGFCSLAQQFCIFSRRFKLRMSAGSDGRRALPAHSLVGFPPSGVSPQSSLSHQVDVVLLHRETLFHEREEGNRASTRIAKREGKSKTEQVRSRGCANAGGWEREGVIVFPHYSCFRRDARP